MDVLADGRVIALVGDDVYVESDAGAHAFALHGTLPAADFPSYGAAFLRVSPDGTKIAVGNNGGSSFADYKVGVFTLSSLAGVWLTAAHYDAEWIDNAYLALTAGDFVNPSIVTILNTLSADPLNPTNPTVVNNIGGASGGIVFDAAGNLYTGNGYQTSGPSGAGAIKAFPSAAWNAAWSGGSPLDFESGGALIVDVLSASPVGMDHAGNLYVGGGDFSTDDIDFVALVRGSAIADVLSGGGSVEVDDPGQLRRLDPDLGNDFNFYSVNHNPVLRRLYVREADVVDLYQDVSEIPAVSHWGMANLGLLTAIAATCVLGRRGGRCESSYE